MAAWSGWVVGVLAAATLGSVGCVGRTPVSLPDDAEFSVLVLMSTEAGEIAETVVFDLVASAEDPSIALEAAEGALVVLYRDSLLSLSLPAGTLRPIGPGEAASHLPPADRAFSVALDEDGDPKLLPLEQVPDAVARHWIPERTPTASCPRVVAEPFLLETPSWVAIYVSLGDGSVLVGTDEGNFERITAGGRDRLSDLTRATPHDGFYRTFEGNIWLSACADQGPARLAPAGAGGALRAEVSPRFLEGIARCDDGGSHVGNPERIVRLDGSNLESPSGSTEPPEIFGLSRGGVLHAVVNGRFEEVGALGSSVLFDFMAWIAKGEVTIADSRPELFWYRNGSVEWVKPELSDGLSPVLSRSARKSGGMLVAGDLEGSSQAVVLEWERARDRWQVLTRERMGTLHALVEVEDGFAYAGRGGALGFFSPRTGFCNVDRDTIPEMAFYGLAQVDRDTFLAVPWREAGIGESDRVFWVHREATAAEPRSR